MLAYKLWWLAPPDHLTSWTRGYRWQAGENIASGDIDDGQSGFYGFLHPSRTYARDIGIWGIIDLYGEVRVHADGIVRGERARIIAVLADSLAICANKHWARLGDMRWDEWRGCLLCPRCPASEQEQMSKVDELLARFYGAPVLRLDEYTRRVVALDQEFWLGEKPEAYPRYSHMPFVRPAIDKVGLVLSPSPSRHKSLLFAAIILSIALWPLFTIIGLFNWLAR